jgi:hypothetical protein
MHNIMAKQPKSLEERLAYAGHAWYAEGTVLGVTEGFMAFEQVYTRLVELTADWGVSASPEEIAQYIRDHADNPQTAGFSKPTVKDAGSTYGRSEAQTPRENGKRRRQ